MTPDDADQFLHESALEMTAGELDAPQTLVAGQRIASYRIDRLLGTGGMSEVYEAYDMRPQLTRPVAVKVLLPCSLDPRTVRERFERETRALAALSHPHICRIFDVCHQDGVDFIVMEHLEGETLAARLQREKMNAVDALEIARQIASALDAAHRAGIVHRDLKPGNVMLTNTGAKLLDFGLAITNGFQDRPKMSTFSVSDSVFGTLEHMAPEQIEGQTVDVRADVFAFGVLLYEMLTGKKPFTGRSQARIISSILKDQPAAPTSVISRLPAALDHIVGKCLAKDPSDRWQTAKDLWEALGRVAAPPRRRSVADDRWIWMAASLSLLAVGVGVWTLRVRSANDR